MKKYQEQFQSCSFFFFLNIFMFFMFYVRGKKKTTFQDFFCFIYLIFLVPATIAGIWYDKKKQYFNLLMLVCIF